MAHRVFFEPDGDWEDMEANGEFIEGETLAELIPKLQAELEHGTYTLDMTYEQLEAELDKYHYALNPV